MKTTFKMSKGEIYQEISEYLMTKLPPTMIEALKEFAKSRFVIKND